MVCLAASYGSGAARSLSPTSENHLYPELKDCPFRKVDIDNDDLGSLGEFDLVICSNVFEHLAKPDKFLDQCTRLLAKGGRFYLSWTNWLSPFGGHDYALFHYFGPLFGRWLKYKLTGKWSDHIPYVKPVSDVYWFDYREAEEDAQRKDSEDGLSLLSGVFIRPSHSSRSRGPGLELRVAHHKSSKK